MRHCDSAIVKPMPVLRMMGKKTEIDVVTVMIKLLR